MIWKLVIKNILFYKKKTLAIIMSVVVASILITSVLNIRASFQNMIIENAYHQYGKYTVIMDKNVYDSKTSKYEDCLIGIERKIGNDSEIGVSVSCMDENLIEMLDVELIEGNLPKKDDEIALDATVKYDGDFIVNNKDIGDVIELEIMDVKREYIITGIIDRYNYSTDGELQNAIVGAVSDENSDSESYNEPNGSLNEYVYVHLTDKLEYERLIKNYSSHEILRGDRNMLGETDVKIVINEELVRIELDKEGSLENDNVKRLLDLVLVLVMATSVVLIMNVFFAFYRERKEQQAILMYSGFSNVNIFKCFFGEGLLLAILGCVVGIIGGSLTTRLIFAYIQSVRVEPLENFYIIISADNITMSFVICILATMVGIIVPAFSYSQNTIKDLMNEKENMRKKGLLTIDRDSRSLSYRLFSRERRNSLREQIFTIMSLLLIAAVFTVFMCVKKYTDYVVDNMEEYESEFQLISNEMDNYKDVIKRMPEVESYDVVYDVSCNFKIDKESIDSDLVSNLLEEDGYINCTVSGISKERYNNKIELSKEVSYEEFVKSGGAIVVDNYLTTDKNFINEIAESYNFKERKDELASFEAGELNVFKRSNFNDWSDQNGISFVLPAEKFEELFDYSLILIELDAKSGYEKKLGEWLNKKSLIYNYSVNDNVTTVIKQKDNEVMIKSGVNIIVVAVFIINALNIIYINKSRFIRNKKFVELLKCLGFSDERIVGSMLVDNVIISMVTAIVGVFLVVCIGKSVLKPEEIFAIFNGATWYYVCVGGVMAVLQVLFGGQMYMVVREKGSSV